VTSTALDPLEVVKSQFMAHNWPVVRRDDEYTIIHNALVEQNGVCGIVLIGDAGVGKTTLARLVTQSLPLRVPWVAGTESARSIPLGVFAHLVGTATASDPVALGWVASLARPAGNMTGATQLNMELGPKRLELMRQLLPDASSIALVINPSNPRVAEVQGGGRA